MRLTRPGSPLTEAWAILRRPLVIVAILVGGSLVFLAIEPSSRPSTRERRYQSAVKDDLRNLGIAQEGHFLDYMTFTTEVQELGYTPTTDVSVVILRADSGGWNARVTHDSTEFECAIFIGEPAKYRLEPASREGELGCMESVR